jgi:hypothetical protein
VPIGGTPGKPADNFVNFLNAQIVSDSTKVLASPTLILSENADELRKGEDTQGINIANLSRGGSGDNWGGGSGSSGSNNNATIGRTKANESFVTVGEQVITNFEVTYGHLTLAMLSFLHGPNLASPASPLAPASPRLMTTAS